MKQMVNLKQFRQKLNITQAAAAESIGIDQRQWNRYENGKNELPIRYLIAICNAYKISADWLLETEFSNWEGDTIKKVIEECYDETMYTISGSDERANTRGELLDMIYYNLINDKDRLLEKYKCKK